MEIRVPDGDDILGRAVRFLIDGGDEKAAAALLGCNLDVVVTRVHEPVESHLDRGVSVVYLVLAGRAGYELLTAENFSSEEYKVGEAIRRALHAVTPHQAELMDIEVRFDQTPAAEGWREDVARYVLGGEVHNQAPAGTTFVRIWENLRFRSESEKRIAQALDRADVLFFPNSRARATSEDARRTVEPDFLVCSNGKWGILEVDGEPFHPPTRTVHDHTRDRVFKAHGIALVEHFDSSECFENPDEVVRKFLALLDR